MRNSKRFSKINEILEIPKEVSTDIPKITIIGFEEMLIENYKGILEYDEIFIRISTHIGIIDISGLNLSLNQMTEDDILISVFLRSCCSKYFKRIFFEGVIGVIFIFLIKIGESSEVSVEKTKLPSFTILSRFISCLVDILLLEFFITCLMLDKLLNTNLLMFILFSIRYLKPPIWSSSL